MNVEVIGDRDFIRSVQEHDGAWVLLSGKSVYMLEVEGGRALPVWVTSQSAENFSGSLKQSGLSPVFVPLGNLLGLGWLGAPELQIVDVLASPVYGRHALTYTAEEFSAKIKT